MRALACAAVFALASGGALAAGDEALLPASGTVGAFGLAGRPRVFSGSELYGHIDGGAEIFFEFGFEQLTVQRYAGPNGEIVVECYRMTDPLAALGIYLGRCGSETPDPALAERHTAGRYQLMLVRDRFFVVVDNPAGTPALSKTLVEFAGAIASRLPASGPTHALDLLPPAELVPGSQRLIRGPLALEALATLGRGDVLQLGGRLTAVAGAYAGPDGRSTLIVASYPDTRTASSAFAHLTANLDPEIRLLEVAERRVVFRDYDGTFGTASVTAARLEIRVHLRTQPPLP